MVLDEPDANLDREGRAALAQAIAELKRRQAIVVLISHQNAVLDTTDRLLILRDGKINKSLRQDVKPVAITKSGGVGVPALGNVEPGKSVS